MNHSIRIEISETLEELKRLHKEQPDKNPAQRLWFLYLLKTRKLTRLSPRAWPAEPASPHPLRVWLNKYLAGGLPELLRRESPPEALRVHCRLGWKRTLKRF